MDPDHYDFASVKCVKDLRLGQLSLREAGSAKPADELSPNERVWPASPRLGDVQLDEILPIAGGCSHEIKFTGGRVMITCEDLHAEWT
ncbi:hypothetical protein [Amycolatopsis sp. SID8362]|uniref:hypothetical protein n=1 Tax=Amycolatopsis sp. SID8362 TaxID=2690346 RepID=UPI001368FD55|nr:hypothetical protein [Amycolatopsis sp. SID8362]NBH05064.1 hypothetical protein [Amycolatopsis sp. SID8362]NED41764.1 hypothetical protein [Amycolatopsis sp. SID8362]